MVETKQTDLVKYNKNETVFYNARLRILFRNVKTNIIKQEAG
jgi:hypothetical protein